jgi:hypothetical protein
MARRSTLPLLAAATVVLAAAFVNPAPLRAQTPPPFAARVDTIRAFFAGGTAGTDYATALALYHREDTRDSACRMLSDLMAVRSTDVIERFRNAAVFQHTKATLPDSLRREFAALWRYAPPNAQLSEHERVAHFAAQLLMAESLGDEQPWYNGRSTRENRADALAGLEEWMRGVCMEGQQEFDSPSYGPVFFCAMLLLRDFAADGRLRAQAGVMAAWLLADHAHEYIGGLFGGAHGREEMVSAMQPISSEMSAIAWLYFGDGPQMYSREQYLASLSSWRPPEAVVELATMKTAPFTAVEWKRSEDRIRGDSVRSRSFPKLTYVDPLYVIGSIPGGLVQSLEQHSWDATWTSDSLQSTLFTMQPYAEFDGMRGFFPHAAERIQRIISFIDPYFGTITKTVGGSPYEHLFQHRNTVVALYDFPPIRRFPLITAFLPRMVPAFEVDSARSGWITIDAGDVYIGYHPLKRFDIFREQYGQRLYSRGSPNGAVVTIVGRNAVPSYREFRRRIRATAVDTAAFAATGTLRYTTIGGDALECRPGAPLRVNGAERRFDAGLLFDSPWISCARGTGVMRIAYSKGTLALDVPNATMRTEPRKR